MGKEEQGINKQRYSVIPRTLILLFNGDEVLLLKGAASKKRWAGKYNGLGGHIERGEDVLSAAIRELMEESGINDCELHLCGTIMCDVEEYCGVTIFVYKGQYDHSPLSSGDEGTLEWIPIETIHQLNLVEDMCVIIPRVYAWTVGDQLFSAINSYDEDEKLVTRFYS